MRIQQHSWYGARSLRNCFPECTLDAPFHRSVLSSINSKSLEAVVWECAVLYDDLMTLLTHTVDTRRTGFVMKASRLRRFHPDSLIPTKLF